MQKKIAIAKGDGIGPEVIDEGVKILHLIEDYSDYVFDLVETPLGAQVWKETGENLSTHSFEQMKSSDAILFGAIGLPGLPQGIAESAILKIRHGLDLYVNLRPLKLFPVLNDVCPLKTEVIGKGIDFTVIRENTEGLYARIGGKVNDETVINNMIYTRKAVERIIDYGYEYASRHQHSEIISVDKANLLHTSAFWREIFLEKGKNYPSLKKTNFYVDAFCQWLLRSPSTVQTVVTENMFGDIISDEGAYLIGSLGMAASGNIHPGKVSMYEPIHGSAPDIAGKNIANPIGTILSLRLMFLESFKDQRMGDLLEKSIVNSLSCVRTLDIFPKTLNSQNIIKQVTTSEMGDEIKKNLKQLLKE